MLTILTFNLGFKYQIQTARLSRPPALTGVRLCKTHGRSRESGSRAGGYLRRCPSRAPCLRARRARFSGLYMGGDAPGPADAQLWGLVALAKVRRRLRRLRRRRRRAAA